MLQPDVGDFMRDAVPEPSCVYILIETDKRGVDFIFTFGDGECVFKDVSED